MPLPIEAETFGEMLKYLRRRVRLTQRELAIAVGYGEAHICRLEKNERLPDLTTVAALFIPALELENENFLAERLLKLAAQARVGHAPDGPAASPAMPDHLLEQELGALESIPAPLAHNVYRAALARRLNAALVRERCVVLCGMPGIGKTTLAADVAREFGAGPVFWHTFTLGVNTSAEAIARQMALFFLMHGQEQVRPLVKRPADALQMPLDQQLLLIRSALLHQPALLCFDDVHLITENETSLSLLRHLIATTPVSLLLTSRQDVPLTVMHIKLGGLESGEAVELVERLGLNLESAIVDRLLTRTDRSPILLRLVAGQLLEMRDGAETFVEHLETQPQVASYLLNAVLSDLSPATFWLAELISVFRQPVNLCDETLSELIGRSDQPCCLDRSIVELQHHHLIDDMCHAVLHPLVRDHLFATLRMDAPRKKRMHSLAAAWSERARGDVVEAAYHWLHAGDLEQAAEIIASQSELLFDRGQAQAAVQVVDLALERIQHRRGSAASLCQRLLVARGDLLRGTFRAAEAETSYREALALAHGIPTVRAQIVRNLAQNLMQRGQAAEALRLCQSAIADLDAADNVLRARLESIECRAHLMLSHFDEARRTARDAIALAEQFAEIMPQLADDVRARAERTLGWISYTRHPQGTESLLHYHRALACARRAGLRVIENAVLSNIGTAYMERGDLDKALQSYQEAQMGFEALGDMYSKAGILHNLGMLHTTREELAEALVCYEQASELEGLVGDLEGLLSTGEARASVLLAMGKLAESRAVLDRILEEDRGSSDTWTLGSCLCLLVEVQVLQGELDAARATVRRVLAMPGIRDNARIRAWALSGLALLRVVAGEGKAARQTVASSPPNDLGFELTFRWLLAQSAAALAQGDVPAAQAIAHEVVRRADQKGYRHALLPAQSILEDPSQPLPGLVRRIVIGE